MVGGTIVDIVQVSPLKWWVNTVESFKRRVPETCAVYVDPGNEPIEVGDGFWWQGGWCMWTPRVYPDGRSDVKLRKIGFSGVPHPHKKETPCSPS